MVLFGRDIAIDLGTANTLVSVKGQGVVLSEPPEVRGRDLESGLPKTVFVTSEEIREAIRVTVEAIVRAARDTLDRTPPELAADIFERGMVLSGGAALLRNLDERLERETGVPVHVSEDPLECMAVGGGRYLEMLGRLDSGVGFRSLKESLDTTTPFGRLLGSV